MSDETKPSTFYDPTAVEGKPFTIADQEDAHELANVQAEQGMNAMDRREGELERQHEDGKTDEERNNIKLMDLLREKYPHAFIEQVDKEGRRLLLIVPRSYRHNSTDIYGESIVYTEYGVASLGQTTESQGLLTKLEKNDLDLTKVTDILKNRPEYVRQWMQFNLPTASGEPAEFRVAILKLDLLDPTVKKNLKGLHEEAEVNVIKRQRNAESLSQQQTAETLVGEL